MNNYMKVILSAVKTYIDKVAARFNTQVNEVNEKVDEVNASIPTKVSQLENDKVFVTEEYVGDTDTLTTSEKNLVGAINEVHASLDNYYLKTEADNLHTELHDYVDTEVAALVNSAPETLDTLGELAAAFEENHDMVETLNEAIAFKANQSDLDKFKTETWTFTLNDGTTVTKQMVVK